MISETRSPELSAPGLASQILVSNLSQGLHAMAQTLTILRASLGKTQIDRMSKSELRELALGSSMEVERVCTQFSWLQQIVTIERFNPDLSAASVLPLIADVTGAVRRVFEDDGMVLRSTVPDICRTVLIDRTRTHQALSIILLIAHGLSRTKDTIELIVSSPSAHIVRVVVRNTTSYLDAVDSQVNLDMALAESNIRSQMGSFSWSLQPFEVQIEFEGVS